MKGYMVEDFHGASVNTFRDFWNRWFCDGEVGDSSHGMNAIYLPLKLADDVISGKDVDNVRSYACVNLRVAIFSKKVKVVP